jgi:hypothetical protein
MAAKDLISGLVMDPETGKWHRNRGIPIGGVPGITCLPRFSVGDRWVGKTKLRAKFVVRGGQFGPSSGSGVNAVGVAASWRNRRSV